MRLSPLSARALRLLWGGFAGCHLVGLTAVGLAGVVGDAAAMVSAALGLALVILFFTIGQAVQVMLADRDPVQVLAGSLLSYAMRAGALGACLGAYEVNRPRLAVIDPTALFVGICAGVLGWLAGEIWTFSRMRIPVYDTEYVPPAPERHEP